MFAGGGADVFLILVEDMMEVKPEYQKIEDKLSTIIDTDPCCIINTSGSTGIPKSVVMNHRSIIDFMDVAFEELNLDGSEIMGSLSPAYFDIYTLELYLMLAKKAQFVVIPSSYALFPEQLVSFIEEKNVNFLFWVPTVMVNIASLDILANHSLPAMEKILFAGEVFPMKHLLYWHRHLPTVTFVNMYGPIEITVDCLYHVLNQEDYEKGVLPIGRPFKNTDVIVLNDNNEVCGKGEMGELCVRGTSLAMGYYNDNKKTAEVFVQNPLNKAYPELIYRTGDIVKMRDDGEILFVGRRDYQIKHLGYRIELGEIESVALSMQEVDNVCVVYDSKEKQIVLFYESNANVTVKDIRLWIGRMLPKYCLPNVCKKIDRMPRNPNGKIDRQWLQDNWVDMGEY